MSKERDEEIFHQFLIRLDNRAYGVVRTNLLPQHPSGERNRVYQALVQEEHSTTAARGRRTHESIQAFHVQYECAKGKFDCVDKRKLVCSHCKQRGHEVSTCFKIHGNPAWYEERIRVRNARQHDGSTCGTSGSHDRCAGGAKPLGGGMTAATRAPCIAASLILEQMQVLMNLINNEQNNGDHMIGEMCGVKCIIVTGASHHITSTLSSLYDVCDVEGCLVGLPNRSSILATKVDVYLNESLVSRDVFLFLSFIVI